MDKTICKLIKASVCLLFLCMLPVPENFIIKTAARPIAAINITEGDADPSTAAIGEEIDFTASFETTLTEGNYSLKVCKSKKMAADAACREGVWCESAYAASDNTLSCSYVTTNEDAGNSAYAMFVCEEQGECSAALSGSFNVKRNTLSLQVPYQATLQQLPFSLEPQVSSGNEIGGIIISSFSNSHSGWSLDLSAIDWQDESGHMMDYDGDGTAMGRLTADLDSATIASDGPSSGLALGTTSSFSDAIKTINIATAAKKSDNGTFTINGIRLDQAVPGNQQEGNYKTILTFTIS